MPPDLEHWRAAERVLRVKKAATNILEFIQLMMPDPTDPDDNSKSRFEIAPHHRLMAEALEKVAKGEILRLCISVAPRHGKSEMFSRMFPAWFLGQDPYRQVIVAGASTEFATTEFGRKIKHIVTSPMYRQVFPLASLDGGSASVENLVFTEGGNIKSIGKGAQVVGRGADCVVGDTLLVTNLGEIPIKNIVESPTSYKVLSFNEQTKAPEFRDVTAFASRSTAWIYRITTTTGRVVEVTGEHPIYNGQSYTKADSLAPGDTVLLSLRGGSNQGCGRLSEESSEGAQGVLLYKSLCVPPLQREARQDREALPRVRESNLDSEGGQHLLHSRVPCDDAAEAQSRDESEVGHDTVSSLRNGDTANDSCVHSKDLLEGVYEQGAFRADERQGELKLHARTCRVSTPIPGLSECVAKVGSDHSETRPPQVCDLRLGREIARTSCGLQPPEQLEEESGCYLPSLPLGTSRSGAFSTQTDTVALVERIRRDCPVFNIQVEGNENFFANGVLTHNCLICDDVISGIEEANSPSERQKLWDWFTTDAMSRLMPGGRVIVIHQRWHNSDLIGRLVDKDCPDYDPKIAKLWTHIKLPAVIENPKLAEALGIPLEVQTDPDIVDQFGDQPIAPLWGSRYGLKFLSEIRRPNPKRFEALYRGTPRLDDGEFFKAAFFKPYKANELPTNLRKYMAGDFAVSTKQRADKTCIVPAGVDEDGTIWILPDVVWRRMSTDATVDAIIALIKRHKPLFFWAEKGHISQSFGPFLKKQMRAEKAFCSIIEKTPSKDKLTRAQAFQAMCSMEQVRFPTFAPWWKEAEAELLRFDGQGGGHDDFCLAGSSGVLMADGTEKPICEIVKGEFVHTPAGPKEVEWSGVTNLSASVFEVSLSNGRTLVATGNHPVKLASGEFVHVDTLTLDDVLVGCSTWLEKERPPQRLSNIEGIGTADIQTQNTSTTDGTSMQRNPGAGFSTGTSGKMPTRRASLRALISTIEITIRSTTIFQTLSLWIAHFIERSTYPSALALPSISPGSKLSNPWPPHGIAVQKAESGINSTAKPLGLGDSLRTRLVNAAERLQKPSGTPRSNSATPGAAIVTVTGVQIASDTCAVYNLTVESEHVFFAEGVLVHNCDALAWLGIGLEQLVSASPPRIEDKEPRSGTMAWLKQASIYSESKKRLALKDGY